MKSFVVKSETGRTEGIAARELHSAFSWLATLLVR
jgi:hypothetical protein